MRRKKLLSLTLALVFFIGSTACGGTSDGTTSTADDTGGVKTISLGSLGSGNESDALSYSCNAFAEAIEKKSGGTIKVDFFPGGQLGSENSMLDQIMTDTLDMGLISSNVIATVHPEYFVFSFPFAFPSLEDFWAVSTSDELENMLDDLTTSCKFLSVGHGAFRGNQNSKRLVESLEDIQGLTFRVMSGEIYSDIYAALGAGTAAIDMSELYTSLQQGVVDGEDNAVTNVYDRRFYEVESYCTRLNMICSANIFVMSNETWNSFTPEEQGWIMEAVEEARTLNAQIVPEITEEYVGKLEEEGMTVKDYSELGEEVIAEFQTATAPIWDKYKEVVGSDAYDTFVQIRDSVTTS